MRRAALDPVLLTVKRLPGLPPYGPMAIPFPSEWGKRGSEGLVVEFMSAVGSWVGSFKPDWRKPGFAVRHPNGRDARLMAGG